MFCACDRSVVMATTAGGARGGKKGPKAAKETKWRLCWARKVDVWMRSVLRCCSNFGLCVEAGRDEGVGNRYYALCSNEIGALQERLHALQLFHFGSF